MQCIIIIIDMYESLNKFDCIVEEEEEEEETLFVNGMVTVGAV